LWLWFALVEVLAAGELEVRCYQAGWSYLERAASYEAGPFWEKVEKAEFESRFLKGAGELRDCRPLFSDQ